MNIHRKMQSFRAYPIRKTYKIDLLISLGVVLLGTLMGYVSKATDSVSIIGDIGTELGIWVFVASIVAAYSRYPFTAALNTMLFFLSMLASYYIYGLVILGFFPRAYFLGWLFISLLSPIAGFIIWFSKGKTILSAIVTALPASILFASGYSAFYTYNIVSSLSLVFGGILIALLPQTLKQKAISFGIAVVLAFIIDRFYLLGLFPF